MSTSKAVCVAHIYRSLLCGLVFQFLFQEFKNQPLGSLNLILRLEQIEYYLLFWNYFAWVTTCEIFQVLLSTSFEYIWILRYIGYLQITPLLSENRLSLHFKSTIKASNATTRKSPSRFSLYNGRCSWAQCSFFFPVRCCPSFILVSAQSMLQ